MPVLAKNVLPLDPKKVYRAMGAGSGGVNKSSNISLPIKQLIEQNREKALELIQYCYTFQFFPVKVIAYDRILLNNTFELVCDAKLFKGASEVALAVISIGPLIEQEVSKLSEKGKLSAGLVLEGYGMAALDELLGFVRAEILGSLPKSGYKLGYSLSPGCCHLPLESQIIIFSLLDPGQIGVQLKASYLAFPAKSCSYIIPVGKELSSPKNSIYICDICEMHNRCTYSPIPLK